MLPWQPTTQFGETIATIGGRTFLVQSVVRASVDGKHIGTFAFEATAKTVCEEWHDADIRAREMKAQRNATMAERFHFLQTSAQHAVDALRAVDRNASGVLCSSERDLIRRAIELVRDAVNAQEETRVS